MAAFRAAVSTDAGIECDVRLAGDGSVVVIHDADLDRMSHVALQVERTPAAFLLGQRLSETDQYIPALRQTLELVAGRVPLLLELKTRDGNAESLSREVLADLSIYQGEVGVMSFDPRVGRWFSKHAPEIRRGIVIGAKESVLRRWAKLRTSRAQFAAVETALVPTRWAQDLRRRMAVATWTVRTAGQRETLANQVDALIWEGDGRPRN